MVLREEGEEAGVVDEFCAPDVYPAFWEAFEVGGLGGGEDVEGSFGAFEEDGFASDGRGGGGECCG